MRVSCIKKLSFNSIETQCLRRWRRRWDLNPRTALTAYTLSRGTSYSHLSTSPSIQSPFLLFRMVHHFFIITDSIISVKGNLAKRVGLCLPSVITPFRLIRLTDSPKNNSQLFSSRLRPTLGSNPINLDLTTQHSSY